VIEIQDRVLRRMFGPKMDEVTGKWRKLHHEGLNDLYWYYSGDQLKNEMDEVRSTYGGEERCIQIFGAET
jgi:hypothetical protein